MHSVSPHTGKTRGRMPAGSLPVSSGGYLEQGCPTANMDSVAWPPLHWPQCSVSDLSMTQCHPRESGAEAEPERASSKERAERANAGRYMAQAGGAPEPSSPGTTEPGHLRVTMVERQLLQHRAVGGRNWLEWTGHLWAGTKAGLGTDQGGTSGAWHSWSQGSHPSSAV